MDENVQSIIEDIFAELRVIGVIRNTDEFSQYWLGSDKSYLRCIRARKKKPGLKSLIHCTLRLREARDELSAANKSPNVQMYAKRLGLYADLCMDQIISRKEA